MTIAAERCYACDRPLDPDHVNRATTGDGQSVFVGPECGARILAAGAAGYQPPKGGPRLFPKAKR